MDNSIRVARLKLMVGVLLLGLVLFGVEGYGTLTRDQRVGFDAGAVDYPIDVIVIMDFRPDPFHMEMLSQHGYYGGRDGDPSRIILSRATRGGVKEIASLPWVTSVEQLP